MQSIESLAEELEIAPGHVCQWGRDRAKVALEAVSDKRGKLILVSAINPTPAGEGKTTMTVSLAMGLRLRGVKVAAALREPSLGPVFGVKGGGTGGGRATIEPADAINLHFTGDIHAVTSAHNLLAALVDNALVYRDRFGGEDLDGRTITWPRAIDMNDRSLRDMIIGLGGKGYGIPRQSRFDITAASEVMAILCLAENLRDLEKRCGRIVVGTTRAGGPVTAADIGAASAMTALLKDALLPNLVQTKEGGPVFVHGGPFANIAHGCNSVLATRMALSHADVTVTEAGFGFDLGGEKFLDIKCRQSGLWPDLVVLVATTRALKYQGGASLATTSEPHPEALARGLEMLAKHLESIASFGLRAVVVLNRFTTDTREERVTIDRFTTNLGASFAECEGFANGGEGALAFADIVQSALSGPATAPRFTYPLEASIEDKLRAVAKTIYGAADVVLTPSAKQDLARIGEPALAVCIAKTHLSLSDQAKQLGRPSDFLITVRELRLAAGAGFVVALAGEIVTMPGLPKVPSARRVVIHEDGRISGLMQGT